MLNRRYEPTVQAAHSRIASFNPDAYARTRNALQGAVTGLSPYITHGFVSLREVLAGVLARQPLRVQHKFVFELGWRAYFRHVWQHRGDGILHALHEGPMPETAYARKLPADLRQGRTGVPAVDQAVRTLYTRGMLHNRARLWLASYVVHIRHVHWRVGADWMYTHLLDGDLASNHLSWQWVAGTGSNQPYLFNADNVARYAPPAWHSPGTVIDNTYEVLEQMARHRPAPALQHDHAAQSGLEEPQVSSLPPLSWPLAGCRPADLAGRDVWLLHPWNLGPLPAHLQPGTRVVGLILQDFHQQWPWSAQRWQFVGQRMSELASCCWLGTAADAARLLADARSVGSSSEPHLQAWLPQLAQCRRPPELFAHVPARCDSFSRWWHRVSRGVKDASELLDLNPSPAR